ncbi:MAG: hypothetical protein V4757_23605 [Pseudomonadota bacterium]
MSAVNLIGAVRRDVSGAFITHVSWGIAGEESDTWFREPSTTGVNEIVDRILAGDSVYTLLDPKDLTRTGPPVRVVAAEGESASAGAVESIEAYDSRSGEALPTLMKLPAC